MHFSLAFFLDCKARPFQGLNSWTCLLHAYSEHVEHFWPCLVLYFTAILWGGFNQISSIRVLSLGFSNLKIASFLQRLQCVDQEVNYSCHQHEKQDISADTCYLFIVHHDAIWKWGRGEIGWLATNVCYHCYYYVISVSRWLDRSRCGYSELY